MIASVFEGSAGERKSADIATRKSAQACMNQGLRFNACVGSDTATCRPKTTRVDAFLSRLRYCLCECK